MPWTHVRCTKESKKTLKEKKVVQNLFRSVTYARPKKKYDRFLLCLEVWQNYWEIKILLEETIL